MKNLIKLLGVIAIIAIITLSFTNCGDDGVTTDEKTLSGTITINPNTATVGTELTAIYSGSEKVTYQWKKGEINVGTNSNKFTPIEAGNYKVIISAVGYSNKTSAAVTVTSTSENNGGNNNGSNDEKITAISATFRADRITVYFNKNYKANISDVKALGWTVKKNGVPVTNISDAEDRSPENILVLWKKDSNNFLSTDEILISYDGINGLWANIVNAFTDLKATWSP